MTWSAADFESLGPARASSGTTWAVPEAVARKFYPVLSPQDTVFRGPGEVSAVSMSGKVESVDHGVSYLSYQGKIAGVHAGTASEDKEGKVYRSELNLVAGAAAYDVKRGQMLSLTWVFEGSSNHYGSFDDPPLCFSALVEWRRDGAGR
jgi:hypothetical protein